MNLNKVQLIGRVTVDPEIKSLPSGIEVANFSIATNKVWKNKDGEKQESVEFHNVVVFGTLTKVLQYVSKGMLLYVEGRLQTRSWEDKDSGKKQYKTEVVVESIQLPPKSLGTGSSEGSESRPAQKSKVDKDFDAMGKKEGDIEYPEESINVDDIPF